MRAVSMSGAFRRPNSENWTRAGPTAVRDGNVDDVEAIIPEAIEQKRTKGAAAYARGKTLVATEPRLAAEAGANLHTGLAPGQIVVSKATKEDIGVRDPLSGGARARGEP